VVEETSPDTPAVGTAGCPSCGADLGPYELVCRTCGAKLKHLPPIENLPAEMREIYSITGGAIANAMTNIFVGRKMGVRLDLSENLLESAQQAAMQGNFPAALELASRSGEEAENLTIQFEALQTRLRKARRMIDITREEGVDMREAEQLLDMALGAGDAGDYKSALRYAIKAAMKADERRSGMTAWKVEIGDWLK
jgi:hypothetical protein